MAHRFKKPAVDAVVQLRHEFCISNAKNETIASATVEKMHGVLWASNLWVHADHRRQGYASRIAKALIAEYGHEDIWINVYPYTDRAVSAEQLIELYQSFGFELTSTPGAMVRKGCS